MRLPGGGPDGNGVIGIWVSSCRCLYPVIVLLLWILEMHYLTQVVNDLINFAAGAASLDIQQVPVNAAHAPGQGTADRWI